MLRTAGHAPGKLHDSVRWEEVSVLVIVRSESRPKLCFYRSAPEFSDSHSLCRRPFPDARMPPGQQSRRPSYPEAPQPRLPADYTRSPDASIVSRQDAPIAIARQLLCDTFHLIEQYGLRSKLWRVVDNTAQLVAGYRSR